MFVSYDHAAKKRNVARLLLGMNSAELVQLHISVEHAIATMPEGANVEILTKAMRILGDGFILLDNM